MTSAPGIPDPHVCEQARLSRDPRFDGLFFTAVTSTRIYCRPICPAPTPKPENIRYFASAAAAEVAGFRPCLRCRPELAPGNGAWQRGQAALTRALKLIDEGFLAERPVSALAARVSLSERQLRRLFVERLGAPPINVYSTRRLLFAKQLLTETTLSITEVALEAGFGSLRRFNAAFRDAYRMAPREVRKRPHRTNDHVLTLRLGYRPPYDFSAILAYLEAHVLPGVEVVDTVSYQRTLGPREAPGWLRVSAWPEGEHALKLELQCPKSTRILAVVSQLRRMFDLDAVPHTIMTALSEDAALRPVLTRNPGLRLPGGWDGFECAVLAILSRHGRLDSVRDALGRLIERYGEVLELPVAPGLERLFPTPQRLVEADLSELGIDPACAESLRGVAQALLEGRVDWSSTGSLEDFVTHWMMLPGIDPWTAHAIALRALGHPDAFPADGALLERFVRNSERWRPWRAYALIHLWHDSIPGQGVEATPVLA